MAQVSLTFNPALRITLAVFNSARTRQTDDGTLRQLVDGLPAGHAPHVQGQGVLSGLLSLQGHLEVKIVIFLACLKPAAYLGRHDPLSLLDEITLGALAVSVLAGPLVALQPGDHPVVATPGTLRSPQRVLAVHPEVLRGTVTRRGNYWGLLSPRAGLSLVGRTEQPLIGSRGPPVGGKCVL